jgi:hypothetical protein
MMKDSFFQSGILSLKLFRHSLRRIAASIRQGSLSGSPVLFANSFPKSGTHLLTQVLCGFTKLGPVVDSGLPAIVTFEGVTGRPRNVSSILRDLSRLKPGDIAYGHLHAIPEVISALTRSGVLPFFVIRDPRDVVVSHVHYVTEIETDHAHHRYYAHELGSFDERLNVSILGRPEFSNPFPNIQERFKPYFGWLDMPEVMLLRFEDLINNRTASLGKIFDHVVSRGFSIKYSRDESIQVLDSVIDPGKSPTYRSGKVGQWRGAFNGEHKQLFKDIAGDLLVQLGYEADYDW